MDTKAKRFTRGVLMFVDWFVVGEDGEPGWIKMLVWSCLVVALLVFAVVFLPIWLPYCLLAKWSGYWEKR